MAGASWDDLTHAQLAALPNSEDARYAKGRWLGAAASTHASLMLLSTIQYLTNEHGIEITSDGRQLGLVQLALNLSGLVNIRIQNAIPDEDERDDALNGFYDAMVEGVEGSLGQTQSEMDFDQFIDEVRQNWERTFSGCDGWKRKGQVEPGTVAFTHGKSVARALGVSDGAAIGHLIALLTVATEKELESLDVKALFVPKSLGSAMT